ncbi:MAG: hypothetical protein ACEQSC_01740, partial [Candidatus Nanopelagicaceae bacterium]
DHMVEHQLITENLRDKFLKTPSDFGITGLQVYPSKTLSSGALDKYKNVSMTLQFRVYEGSEYPSLDEISLKGDAILYS